MIDDVGAGRTTDAPSQGVEDVPLHLHHLGGGGHTPRQGGDDVGTHHLGLVNLYRGVQARHGGKLVLLAVVEAGLCEMTVAVAMMMMLFMVLIIAFVNHGKAQESVQHPYCQLGGLAVEIAIIEYLDRPDNHLFAAHGVGGMLCLGK